MVGDSGATDRTALVVRDVTHAYGAHSVLNEVTLAVPAGTMVAVVGPSGSGKSTLLSIAGLLMAPDHGTVVVDGRRALPRRLAGLRRIGWVFQTTNALGRRTAAENVAQPLLAAGWTAAAADRHARSALARLGIDGLADQRAADCSGGELQRVCIARALVADPAVIVADEPTGQLDVATSEVVIDTLRAACEFGAAILLATHDPMVAEAAHIRYELRGGTLA